MEEELLSEEEQKELYPHSDTLRINKRHVDFGKAVEGVKTVQNWKDPFDVTAAAAASLVPQTLEEWMFETATLGQGKKINLGRKLAHAALKDIPFTGPIYEKGTAYVSNKLDNWLSPKTESYPAWESQNIPRTQSNEFYDIAKRTGIETSINWTRYGYKDGKLPTQVQRAKDPILVSGSLNEFYSKVDRIVGSIEGSQGITSGRAKEVIKQIPTWWTHPETGKLYRSAWNSKEKRLTIKPISRNLLENQQTSVIQKRNYRKYKKEIASMNETLKKELETTQLELDKLDQELPAVMRHAGAMGKDGSSKSAVMNSFFAKRNQLATKIEDLANGKYYTEHGYYLLSEKVRNTVLDNDYVSINNSKQFQLGDLKNQYVTKNVDKFSEFKTRIETAVDSLNDGYYNYPDLVVGYNPKIDGKEYIIRIENLNSLKVGKDVQGVLSGDAILKIDFNDKKLVKKLSSTEGVKQWLSENGIEASSKELSRKPEKIIVRTDRKPLETATETKNRILGFQSMLDQVYDMRVSIEDYLKSLGTTAGDAPKTIGRPKGATDIKRRKTKIKDQGKLDL